MPRNISFAWTTPQFRDRSKTVTRRIGWKNLKKGDILCGVEKGMGLKKGEKVKRLGLIEVVSARRERLCDIPHEDCAREGFPDLNPREFVAMFQASNRCYFAAIVTRIEFKYLDHDDQ